MLQWEDLFFNQACKRAQHQGHALKALHFRYRAKLTSKGGCSDIRKKRKSQSGKEVILDDLFLSFRANAKAITDIERRILEDMVVQAQKQTRCTLCKPVKVRQKLGSVTGYYWHDQHQSYQIRISSGGKSVHICQEPNEAKARQIAKRVMTLRDNKLQGVTDVKKFRKALGLCTKEPKGYYWNDQHQSYQIEISSGGKRVHICLEPKEAKARKTAKKALKLRSGRLRNVTNPALFKELLGCGSR
jgi:hypothetical protein